MFSKIIIIGVGLLGGSIGLAAKKNKLTETVIGVGRTEKTLEIAKQRGIIDQAFTSIRSVPISVPVSENPPTLAIVCTPVSEIVRSIQQLLEHFGQSEHLLISDAGSTKNKIVQEISDTRFLGSHPIAGSERSGPSAADAELFRNRLTVLTPTKHHSQETRQLLRRFWETLGSTVVEMDAAKHDAILAVTSHLPHVLSVALSRTISNEETPFTGTGFADMTRLAAGSPEIWRDIFCNNKENILSAIQRFEEQLHQLTFALQSGHADSIESLLRDIP